MLVPNFPDVPEEGYDITFNRDQALAREETQFINWKHQIIRNGLDFALVNEGGSSVLLALPQNKALPVGTSVSLLLGLVYVVESEAPRNLQLKPLLARHPAAFAAG